MGKKYLIFLGNNQPVAYRDGFQFGKPCAAIGDNDIVLAAKV
jgi:hypothetical protein